MVLIDLGSPEEIIGWNPKRYENSWDFTEGEYSEDVTFHFVVPPGQKYRVKMEILITGVAPPD
jgi:hypothetical protein